jgi:putative nucleotidyltransferase with HDIG domain
MTVSDNSGQIHKDIPDKIIQKVSRFPNMPQAGIKLRSLLTEKDVSVDEIEKILRHDPGLAANVLRLANSAYFGIPAKVSSLKHAVVLLGVKRFAQIAVGACMNKTMDRAVEGYRLSPGELWLHSIAVSTTAEALAKNRKLAETSDFFTPALLHDLGKLVLGEFVKAELPKIKDLLGKGLPFVIAEKEVLGTDHAEIGALILNKWQFPGDLINAVRWHHYPGGVKNSNLHPEIVYLANLLCQFNSNSDADEEQNSVPYPSVLNRLGIKSEQYEVFAKKARGWMKKLSDTLTFD